MAGDQLPLFQRKTYKGVTPSLPIEIHAPTGDSTVLQTLPAYYTYLMDGGFSKYTPDDFTSDLKKFGLFFREKQIKVISEKDIKAWISFLKAPSPKGEGLSAKTVSRKLSALSNYFFWLTANKVIREKENPMNTIVNIWIPRRFRKCYLKMSVRSS